MRCFPSLLSSSHCIGRERTFAGPARTGRTLFSEPPSPSRTRRELRGAGAAGHARPGDQERQSAGGFRHQQREEGMGRREALLSAGRTRLRPIIMTTVAMIFGMLPLALALGEGAEQRAPMGRAVIGGLITSTLLTLFVVPVVYTLLDDFTNRLFRRGAQKAHRAPVAAPRPEPIAAD
ncbi:MAG TPA: efflux RND transporter permease subunit [Longimicrobium sp.]